MGDLEVKGTFMHHTEGSGWHIRADTLGTMVLALYLRDIAGLQGAGHPTVSPVAPKVHTVDSRQLLTKAGGLIALRTEWEAWWAGLAVGDSKAVTALTPPAFDAFAGAPALRLFAQAHFGTALTFCRERRGEYAHLEAERAAAGEPKILRQLVEDREMELGRNARNFTLSLTELPLTECRAWFVEPNRMILSQDLLADEAQTRSFVQPVIEMLV